jgi:ribosome-associated toxin RatA of RatAB toxin-antitoxin module
MKELNGNASQVVSAPIEDCFQLLEAVDRYPAWHPAVVKEVDIVERDADGKPTQVRTTLHVSVGPIVRDFHLLMAVQTTHPTAVSLERLRNQPSDREEFEVRWHLTEQGASTRITLDVAATLSVPRLVPVGGIGDTMASGFVVAAAAAIQS